jgi:regulator of replication initiation timing
MRKFISILGVFLLSLGGSNLLIADDDFEIKLIDDSSKSGLKQKHIVGCNDHLEKKELTCSKEPEEIILSKLPTSKELDRIDFSAKNDIEKIKTQLKSVIEELSRLKKEREEDKKIIEKLSKLIEVMSEKSNKEQKEQIVKKNIEKIVKRKLVKKRSRYIPRRIKEIARYDDYVVIEVQKGESLSSYAQYYYNDQNKYYRIYKANRDKISPNLEVIIGDRLIIPLDY